MREIVIQGGRVAKVDDEDYHRLARYPWHLSDGYAVRHDFRGPRGARRIVKMHHEVLGVGNDALIDHRDNDRLNNCRENLRHATQTTNAQNRRKSPGLTSRYKGVALDRSRGRWKAYITINGKRVYMGTYTDEVEAARVYDRAAREHFGEFARLNFPAP